MDTLHQALLNRIGKLPESLLSKAIAKKAKEQGVNLTRGQLQRLVKHLIANSDRPFTISRWQWWKGENITLRFSDEDLAELTRDLSTFIESDLQSLVDRLGIDFSSVLLAALKKQWPPILKANARGRRGFQNRLAQKWRLPLDSLELLLEIAREYGASFAQQDLGTEFKHKEVMRDVLVRLHARACQVTDEIMTLLRAGFADGAMARWRTLHEIATVALLISQYGPELAKRYVAHEEIESHKAAKQFNTYSSRLGQEPLRADEVAALELRTQELIKEYGRSFRHDYGWAAHHIGKAKPTFADLEEALRIDHLRPYYKLASHNVHANPKGIFFKLGLLPETMGLLAGASDGGLADPGQTAAISLLQVSTALVELEVTFDHVVLLRTMQQMVDEIGGLFSTIEDNT